MEHRRLSLGKVLTPLALAILLGAMIFTAHAQPLPGGTLDPTTIPKYVDSLPIPAVQPPIRKGELFTLYGIEARQFRQQVLPSGFRATPVWGYGATNRPGPGRAGSTFSYPGHTIEVHKNEQVVVNWINGLMNRRGEFLPHLFSVDPTLHWANPPGPRDERPVFTETPGPYRGPVPIVTHLHGGHTSSLSDGYPEAWYLPNARNIPAGFFTQGSRYGSLLPVGPGAALFQYDNDQPAATLWYHDHALGLTRLNVYAGLAGFYIIRDRRENSLNLPGPAPRLGDSPDTRYYEIPILIQDRSFNRNGSFFYPGSREFFDEFDGPFIPETDVPPIWNPEFFGNTMVVNGKTWPVLEVEPRLYRFRLLNGCNSRFLILRFGEAPVDDVQPSQMSLPQFHQIGSDGGLLRQRPVVLDELLLGPAERADVIVDFSQLSVGDEVLLLNVGPDEPFGGLPVDPSVVADPDTTGQVMKFKVVALTNQGNRGTIPARLPGIRRLTTDLPPRELTLNEEESSVFDGPVAALLGTAENGPITWGGLAGETGMNVGITEKPVLGTTEEWHFINLTEDSHTIHLHLVQFQVVNRQAFDAEAYHEAQEAFLADPVLNPKPALADFLIGDPIAPNRNERGRKDTVIANPGEVTRIIATFDRPGLYVWHCHILEHEDNEMMRPYEVVAPVVVQPPNPLLEALRDFLLGT